MEKLIKILINNGFNVAVFGTPMGTQFMLVNEFIPSGQGDEYEIFIGHLLTDDFIAPNVNLTEKLVLNKFHQIIETDEIIEIKLSQNSNWMYYGK